LIPYVYAAICAAILMDYKPLAYMTVQRDKLESLPFGQLATRQWLLANGLPRHAFDNAMKSKKLVALARGVVARPGAPVGWEGLAASLSRMLGEPVYVGGMSALELAGLVHYLRLTRRIALYSAAPCPSWLDKLDLGVDLVWHSTRRLWRVGALQQAGSLKLQSGSGGAAYWLASPEQAMLEVLADVPDTVSFEHADQLMQGLTSLSPRRLDVLLQGCRHVQVKRLFFFFAARWNYSWFQRLDRADYDLGSGKRVVVKGGRLDRDYLITVPESFHGRG